MTSTAITAYEASQDRIGLNAAYRLLWLSVGFDVLAFGVGFEWDRRWHATHAFEGFFFVAADLCL